MGASAGGGPRLPPVFQLIALDRVSSTMDEARRLAEEGAEEGTLVWGREQTGGRGRLGRQWVSPRGNLYLSLVLRPEVPLGEAAQFGFVAALAIGEAIGSVAPPVDVTYKWPNDVLVNGRKVSGVLLEAASRPDGALDFIVLGCGINLLSFPEGTGYPATCLRFEGAREVTEEELLEAFARHFLAWTSRWRDEGFAAVRKVWLRHADRLGEQIKVNLPRETLEGRFEDLDESGRLRLRLPDGSCRHISSGDVFAPA